MTEPDTPENPPPPNPPERTQPPRVDPEDWESTSADDDERYQRERPPHWR